MVKVRVRCTYFQPIGGYGDWLATCPCGDRLTSHDWEGAITWALGHQSFAHPKENPMRINPRALWEATRDMVAAALIAGASYVGGSQWEDEDDE